MTTPLPPWSARGSTKEVEHGDAFAPLFDADGLIPAICTVPLETAHTQRPVRTHANSNAVQMIKATPSALSMVDIPVEFGRSGSPRHFRKLRHSVCPEGASIPNPEERLQPRFPIGLRGWLFSLSVFCFL